MVRHVRLQRSLRFPPPSSAPLSRLVSRHRSPQLWMLALAPCGAFARTRIALRSRTLDRFPFRGSCLGAYRTRVVLATEPAHAPLSRIMYGRDRMPRMLRPQSRHAPLSRLVLRSRSARVHTLSRATLTSAASTPSSFESGIAVRSYASDAYVATSTRSPCEAHVAARSYALDAYVATPACSPFEVHVETRFVRIIRCIRTPCLSTIAFRRSYFGSFMRAFRRARTCRLSTNHFRGSYLARTHASCDACARVALTSDSRNDGPSG